MAEPLGVLLIGGDHERAHYAFVVAAAAAALGRAVTVLATNDGCRGLMADWSGLPDARRDAQVQAAGVAGLDTLRASARELGVRLIACDSGLAMAGLDPAGLMPGVEVGGISGFLAAVGGGQIVTL